MTFATIQIIAFQLVLPVLFIYSLWTNKFTSKLNWITQLLFTVMFIAWIFFSGSWDFIGFYLRYVLLALLFIAIYRSWKKARLVPLRTISNTSKKWSLGINILLVLVFGMYNVFIIGSYTTQDKAIELTFPLNDGTYYVGQGGSNTFMNYHSAYLPQKYALDIVRLNKLGLRASGLYPKELDKYVIYGDTLYSPCNGEVLEARRHLPDQTPPASDPENALGNYVALTCENEVAVIYLAHMQEGSVAVEAGSSIQVGEKVGSIGNSGNTSEPHLHIHAEKDGKGIPIRFNGKFLVKNNLVR